MTASVFKSQREVIDKLKVYEQGLAIAPHWRVLVVEGVVMIVLGVLAIAYPVFATLAVDLYLGWLFLFSGLFALIATFSARQLPGFWWALVTALVSVLVGTVLIWRPGEGVVSLTAVLTAFFVVEGVFQAAAAISYREVIPHSWGWLLASGIADLALAAIIISGWPGTVGWTLGLLAGVSLLTSGWAIVMVSLSLRSLAQSVNEAIEGA